MSDSTSSTIDDSLWPLLVARPVGSLSHEQLEDHLEARARYLHRPERHVLITDAREIGMPTLQQRQRYIAWLQEHDTLLRERVLGTAFVTTSPFVRLVLSVVHHIHPSPTPYIVAPSLSVAASWAADRLHEAGLTSAAWRVQSRFGLPTG